MLTVKIMKNRRGKNEFVISMSGNVSAVQFNGNRSMDMGADGISQN